MEFAIAIRDGVFWWVGNWALFTGLDAAIVWAVLRAQARADAVDRENVVSAISEAVRRANETRKPVTLVRAEDAEETAEKTAVKNPA